MLKKVKCSNCGEEVARNTTMLEEDLRNILCERCAKGSKKECDDRAKQNRRQ